jgi:hypothetical protein
MIPPPETHQQKPTNPYPRFLRRVLRRMLSDSFSRLHFVTHEQESLEVWRHLATELSDQDAILDVGAFHGEYSLAARDANPRPPIFDFEPDAENLAVLTANCEQRNINVCPVALSERSGTAHFFLPAARRKAGCWTRAPEGWR